MIKIDDIVRLKGDDHKYQVKHLYLGLGKHVPEATIEVIGEAWQRIKRVPVADLELTERDLAEWPA